MRNGEVLQEAYDRLTRSAAEPRTVLPAGSHSAGVWLVENFSRVKELMRSARRDLRKGRRRELPHLCDTASEGLPRVYHLARELIAHLRRPTRPGEPPPVLQRLPDRGAAESGGTVVGLRHVAAGPHRIPLPRGDPCCSAGLGKRARHRASWNGRSPFPADLAAGCHRVEPLTIGHPTMRTASPGPGTEGRG